MCSRSRRAAGRFPLCHVPAFHAEPVGEAFNEWRLTGHAEIFTNHLNDGGHYGESRFVCHSVGYDMDASNAGIDDAANYQAFNDKSKGIHNPSFILGMLAAAPNRMDATDFTTL